MPINIKDTQKEAFVPDMTLAPQVPMDLASIKAQVSAIEKEALRIQETLKGMPQKQTDKIEETKPTEKPSFLDSVMGRAKKDEGGLVPEKQDFIGDYFEQKEAFLQRMGITSEDYEKTQNLASQMASLNQQLQLLEVEEQQQLLDAERTGRLTSITRGEQAFIQRQSAIQKAGIAAQISGLSMQYNIAQGRIDEATVDFEKALNFATTKERQQVEDYRWALSFYTDLEKTDRNYLQQEYENKLKEYEIARDEKWKQLSYNLEKAKSGISTDIGSVDSWVSLIESGQANIANVPSSIKNEVARRLAEVPEGIPAPPDYINTFNQYKDAGWSRTQVENTWISQYNQGKAVGMQIKDAKQMNKQFPEIKASLDQVFRSPTPGFMETLSYVPATLKSWWTGIMGK
jgi:frataxin-like iron-binding protein CyaY